MRATVAALVAVGAILVAAAPGDASCVGRYVVLRARGALLRRALDVIVLGVDSAVIDPTCGAAPIRARGRRIVASWPRCDGRVRMRLRARLTADCSVVRGSLGATAFTAATSVCGDGIVDPGNGETCDDGNTFDGDGCDESCGVCSAPATFASTWDAIGVNVFQRYGCTSCHGHLPGAPFDLGPPGVYDRIVDVAALDAVGLFEIRRGDRRLSLLWLKLAKATFGDDAYAAVPGHGMPIGGRLTPDELEAFGRWIDGGAPRDGLVPGAGALLASCAAGGAVAPAP